MDLTSLEGEGPRASVCEVLSCEVLVGSLGMLVVDLGSLCCRFNSSLACWVSATPLLMKRTYTSALIGGLWLSMLLKGSIVFI